jgi:hypothetical protein
VTVEEPLEFFPGFGKGARAIWEVRPDLRIAIEPVECIQVAHFEVPKDQTFGFQDDHGTRRGEL